jgi:lipoprotein-anchoring transpeptidase ErfK/SrfK
MGVRKIGIDYPGVFFHGVPAGEFSSIGTHASHGCMRMMPSAVADLFTRVKVGDKVFIRGY